MQQLLLFPDFPPAMPQAPPLSSSEQQELLEALPHGGSPQVICRRMGRRTESFSRTVAADPAFRRRLGEVRDLMTHNVLATLYKAALEGGASAQGLWLKTFPPRSADEPTQSAEKDNDREPISEDDLRDWALFEQFLRTQGASAPLEGERPG